jgi:hypothetical protein
LDLNDSKFNAKFVSGGYILLYDTGFYSKIKNGTAYRTVSGTAYRTVSGTANSSTVQILDRNV